MSDQLIRTSIPGEADGGPGEAAKDQLVCADIPVGGVEPHGIDTRTRAPGVVRDGTETPSNGGKHG